MKETSNNNRGSFLTPFRVFGKRRLTFIMWLLFSLIGGAVGIIVSILRHSVFTNGLNFRDAFAIEILNGAFYTYSIALIAASLGSVFINFVDNEQFRYRRYKVILIALSIYALLFGGIMYALSINSYTKEALANAEMHFSWGQLIILILAICLSIYSFFVCRMDDHSDLFDDLVDSFEETKQQKDFPEGIPGNEK